MCTEETRHIITGNRDEEMQILAESLDSLSPDDVRDAIKRAFFSHIPVVSAINEFISTPQIRRLVTFVRLLEADFRRLSGVIRHDIVHTDQFEYMFVQ